jgi:hypothetical protein
MRLFNFTIRENPVVTDNKGKTKVLDLPINRWFPLSGLPVKIKYEFLSKLASNNITFEKMHQECDRLKILKKIKEAIKTNLNEKEWDSCLKKYPLLNFSATLEKQIYSFQNSKEKEFPPAFLQWIKKLKDAKEN